MIGEEILYLPLSELAKRIEVSPPFLSDIELGRRHPSEDVLERVARVLGTTVEDLRKFDARPPVQELKRIEPWRVPKSLLRSDVLPREWCMK